MVYSSGNLPDIEQNANKDILIKTLMETVSKLQTKYQSEDDEEKQWMIQNCSNSVIIDFLKESTVIMLHVIDAIGQLEPINGTSISKQFGIPKGSVSKITRKLIQKKIISIEFLPDNKKEVLFRTTPLGKEIFYLHQSLHKQMNIGINYFLQKYEPHELLFLTKSLEDTLKASWVNPEPNIVYSEEKHSSLAKENLGSMESEEINDILEMLQQLDTRNLRKARTILKDVFFTSFDV